MRTRCNRVRTEHMGFHGRNGAFLSRSGGLWRSKIELRGSELGVRRGKHEALHREKGCYSGENGLRRCNEVLRRYENVIQSRYFSLYGLRRPGSRLRRPGLRLRRPGSELRRPGSRLRRAGSRPRRASSLSQIASSLSRIASSLSRRFSSPSRMGSLRFRRAFSPSWNGTLFR